VARAWDPTLQRWVALKFLRFDDAELEERMFREARAQAKVDHPNICPVYEVGRDEGRVFIAMHFIDGVPLDQLTPHPGAEQAASLIRTIAEALHAAHAAGLVHRDIKPANILVEETEEGLKPWIVDFGIARERDVPGLTMTGQILGTPGYLSPEQARGEVTTIDRRSDVFSLGIVLYELLAGRKPFKGESTAQMLISVLQDEAASLRQVAPHVPKDLRTIVMKCLEHRRDDRYPSARALAEDLRRFLDGEPVLAQPVSSFRRLYSKMRRNPKIAAAIVLLSLAAVVSGGIAVHARLHATRRERLAQRFGREVERARRTLELAYLRPRHDIRPDIEKVHRQIAGIESESSRLGSWAGGIGHAATGHALAALGRPEEARVHLEEAWARGEQTPGVATGLGLVFVDLYRAAFEEAQAVRNRDLRLRKLAEAEKEFKKPALDYLSRSDPDDEHAAYLKAVLLFLSDRDQEALQSLAELKTREPFFYQGDLLAGVIWRRRYVGTSDGEDPSAAERAFEESDRAFRAATMIGESDPQPYRELCNLWVQELRRRFYGSGKGMKDARDRALDACSKALEVNPDLGSVHVDAGRACRYWTEFEHQRERPIEESLAAEQEHIEAALDLDPANVEAMILLGLFHRQRADFSAEKGLDPVPELNAAVGAYREAIRIRPGHYGALNSLSVAHARLGVALAERGKDPTASYRAAAEAARKATEFQPELVDGWVNLGIAEAQAAIVLRDRGEDADLRFQAGVEALERAVTIKPAFVTAHFNLAELLLERAEGILWLGEDPENLVRQAESYLETTWEAYPAWAAPYYLGARGMALIAEKYRRTGGDPAPFLGRAEDLIRNARKIRRYDAEGLTAASLSYLVAARFALQHGRDPGPAVQRGLALIDSALQTNPAGARSWISRAEFLLIAAAGQRASGQSSKASLSEAWEAIQQAGKLVPEDLRLEETEAAFMLEKARWQVSTGAPDAGKTAALGLRKVQHVLDRAPLWKNAKEIRAALENISGTQNFSS